MIDTGSILRCGGEDSMPQQNLEIVDDNTLDSLGEVICDTDGPHHRQGWELPQFFRRAGWTEVPDYDESGRKRWVVERLRERRRRPGAINSVILRLADPREYQEDPRHATAVAQQLNRILALEARKITFVSGRPAIVDLPGAMIAPDAPAPLDLKKDIATFIQDPLLVGILRTRLDEASTCREHGASLATVILLGSIMEGALLDVATRFQADAARCGNAPRDRDGKLLPLNRWNLDKLIDVAHELHWIQADVRKFASSLRDYRNLVHPDAQRRLGQFPDRDTVNVCWEVVVATLNDLAESAQR